MRIVTFYHFFLSRMLAGMYCVIAVGLVSPKASCTVRHPVVFCFSNLVDNVLTIVKKPGMDKTQVPTVN